MTPNEGQGRKRRLANESRTAMRFEEVYAETASMVLNLAFRMTGSQICSLRFIKIWENSANRRRCQHGFTALP